MGGQTQEKIGQNWLTPEALIDFIEELRHTGFNIGVAEYIAVQDLLLMLTARGESLDHPQRAVALLGPLLCSTPAEQRAFPDYFARWAERHPPVLQDQKVTHEQTMAEALDETAKRGLRLEWFLFIGVVVLLLGFSSFIIISNIKEFLAAPVPTEPPIREKTEISLQIVRVAILLLGGASLVWIAAWRL